MVRSVVILYGTETGNSQDFARLLSRRCEHLRFETTVSSLDDFDLKKLLDTQILIVFCSTTGQGEIPRNAKKFWKFMLKKRLPSDLLSHMVFTTFGLGDSSYPKFNYAIKKIHKRLLQLGGTELSPRAESDEQNPEGIEGFYVEWEKLLVNNLLEKFPLPLNVDEIPMDTLLLPKQKATVEKSMFKKLVSNADSLQRQYPGLMKGKISVNERITSEDHFQDVRHIEIESYDMLNYQPGDTLALYPSNDDRDVEALIVSQNWSSFADFPLKVSGEPLKIEGGVIKKLTLRSLLKYHLDIMSIPRRSFFMNCWHFASDERERNKLRDFAKIEESEELYNYANRPRRSISETIQEFFSLQIPLEYILEVIPTMKPRLFSIASKPDPMTVQLCVAIVEYKTILRRVRKGVCTRWLKTLQTGDEVVFTIHEQNLHLGNSQLSQPILMIGPGTGIAPIKSLIETKISQFGNPNIYLFTGNRYHDKDYLYGDLWMSLQSQGKLQIFNAFSREKGGYVQDKLYQQKQLVYDLIVNQNAFIYLCGSSGKMPTQVRITLETIFQESGENISEEDAKKLLLSLEDAGRYIQETW